MPQVEESVTAREESRQLFHALENNLLKALESGFSIAQHNWNVIADGLFSKVQRQLPSHKRSKSSFANETLLSHPSQSPKNPNPNPPKESAQRQREALPKSSPLTICGTRMSVGTSLSENRNHDEPNEPKRTQTRRWKKTEPFIANGTTTATDRLWSQRS